MNRQGGFVLVIVLVAVALLVSLVTVFISEVYLETGSTRSSLEITQGSLYAAAGISGAQRLLTTELGNRSYSSLTDSWASPLMIADPQGQGALRVTIVEENGKLNLNAIALPNGTLNQGYYEIGQRLFRALKLPLAPLDAVADWVDEGDTPHPGGAEIGWYQGLKQPYRPRNKPLITLEELKRVKGMAELFTAVSPFVTVYGDLPAGSPAAPVNINTAPKELLMALDDGINEALAQRIIDHRTEMPFRHPAELGQVPGMAQITTGLLTRISAKGTVFRIRSEGMMNNVIRGIEAVVRVNGSNTSVLYWREY